MFLLNMFYNQFHLILPKTMCSGSRNETYNLQPTKRTNHDKPIYSWAYLIFFS